MNNFIGKFCDYILQKNCCEGLFSVIRLEQIEIANAGVCVWDTDNFGRINQIYPESGV